MALHGPTSTHAEEALEKSEVVSTHVLVEQEKVDKLRELSKRTRIAQSEYLREAVDDLLNKYDRSAR
ncbi:MAG: ribbon-helix-helix domain-containing protein [Myxococcota bacterium]